MINRLVKLWSNAETSVEYIVALWIYFLFTLVAVTWLPLVIEIIINLKRFSNISFGLIDYL